MKNRHFLPFSLLSILLTLFLVAAAAAQEEPATVERRLPDLRVFADQPHGQWAGAGNGMELETGANASLPVDETEMHGGLPSYRVNVTGENGWWSFILAGRDWEPYDITSYYPDGALMFNIKGAAGGEEAQIALNDIVHGRTPLNVKSSQIPLSSLVTMTDTWQTVRIPLATLLAGAPQFDLQQQFTVEFSGAGGGPQTFWLNDIRFTATAEEPGAPAIKLNQLGYLPGSPKRARVSGFPDELVAEAGTPFQVRELASNRPVYSGALTELTPLDPVVSGEKILIADFTQLTTPGNYYLSVDAYRLEDSPPFSIAPDLYRPLLADTLHYFYLQRAGMPLEEAYAGIFARGAGHPQDAAATLRSGGEPLDVSGGWYDAGDYGKYVNAGAAAISDLLWAYELFPEQFPDGHLNIPENGNGVPDLLDEIRWELDWIMRMQDPASGGFYHMVQPTESVTADDAAGQRFIEDVDGERVNVRPTGTTGSAAAALAHAALIFEPVDGAYSAELLAAAEAAWAYLEAHPEGVAPVRGPYSDGDDRDDRFWAAAALYRVTGEERYDQYVRRVYRDLETFFTAETDNAYGVGRMEMMGWLHYAAADGPDQEVMTYFREIFEQWSARMVERWEESAWDIALLDEDFYWGSNYVTLTTPLVMVVGARVLGLPQDAGRAVGLDALNYLLGANPLRFSYVSGYGQDALARPFSNQWSNDGVGPVPAGILAGGPNAYTNPLLHRSNFAARHYVDSNGAWSVNEHTVYWNSALVFHAALAVAEGDRPVAAADEPPAPVPEPTVAPAGEQEPAAAASTPSPAETESSSAAPAGSAGVSRVLLVLLGMSGVWLLLLSGITLHLWRRTR